MRVCSSHTERHSKTAVGKHIQIYKQTQISSMNTYTLSPTHYWTHSYLYSPSVKSASDPNCSKKNAAHLKTFFPSLRNHCLPADSAQSILSSTYCKSWSFTLELMGCSCSTCCTLNMLKLLHPVQRIECNNDLAKLKTGAAQNY